MSLSTTSTTQPAARPAQYIIKLKDDADVDIKTHIQTLTNKYSRNNQALYNITHEWDPSFVKAYVGEFSPDVLEDLKRHKDVDYISENSEADDFEIIDQNDAGWGLSRINQAGRLSGNASAVNFPYKYDGSLETGAGVDIYILDTGIYIEHEDFGGRAIWGTTVDQEDGDFHGDTKGHGTHVAGIAGGKRWGVAKDATLIAVKMNHTNAVNAVKGIEWILERVRESKVPSVVNMSHGTPNRNRFWKEQVTKLVQNGIHVVIAAGNRSWDARNTSPAGAPLVNTVGSVNIDDEQAPTSNYGPCVDFFAPGVKITSCGITSPSATAVKSGTSMAAPVVTGIIATLISLHGDVPPLMMTNILRTLSLKNILNKISSGTTNALVRGALHVDTTFSMESDWASMRLLDGTPPFDFKDWLKKVLGGGTNHGLKIPSDVDDAASKLETVNTFSRAILSKVQSGASVYSSNVTEFTTSQIVCQSDLQDEGDDDDNSDDDDDDSSATITVPLMIVGNYPAIDIALDRDSDGKVTVSFAKKDYVNDEFDPESGGDFNQVVFKACPLE